MSKLVWSSLVVTVVVAASAAYYFAEYYFVDSPDELNPSIPPHRSDRDEVLRKKREGIGDIRKLKPVPLPEQRAR